LFQIFFSFFFSKAILRLVSGKDEAYIDLAFKYVIFNFPVMVLEFLTSMYSKHLEALMLFHPFNVSDFICLIIQIICYFIFFDYLKLEILGCGISQFIAMLSFGSSIFGYLNYYSIMPEENFWSFSSIFTNF